MSSPGTGSQAAFPQIGTEFVNEHRLIAIPWYRLLIQLWRLAGGANIPISQAVYFILQSPLEIEAFSVDTGAIGFLQLQNQPGGAAVPQTPAGSPFVYTAAVTGTLVAFCGEIELSRDSGTTYYKVSLTGGAVPMLKGDKVRVSWVGGSAPTVTWFPSS